MRNGAEGQMRAWDYRNKEGMRFITKPDWQVEGIDLGFSTRLGGVSSGIYESLNMGLHVGDEYELVCENRRRFLAVFNAGLDNTVCCQQVHGAQVYRVEESDRGCGAHRLSSAIPDCDALITDRPGIYLLSFYADCVPVYFYDPGHRAIGIAHCGWKGTVGRIAGKTVAALQNNYQTEAANMQVFIGPGIGPCCFAIQADLMAQVHTEFRDLHDIITMDDKGSAYWDLQETNRQLLIESGVKASNISVCQLCTSCHTDIFYSHRKERGLTGRMGALIGLKY